jgi:hypothetical protein
MLAAPVTMIAAGRQVLRIGINNHTFGVGAPLEASTRGKEGLLVSKFRRHSELLLDLAETSM